MCSKIILLPVAPKILPGQEPFGGGNIDCSEIGIECVQDQITYPPQDRVIHTTAGDGSTATATSGQPKPNHYGPPPDFAQLDANQDGVISRQEAEAYMPLFNDFDCLAHHTGRIYKYQFENWVRTQGH
jgi:hypothetical protein